MRTFQATSECFSLAVNQSISVDWRLDSTRAADNLTMIYNILINLNDLRRD